MKKALLFLLLLTPVFLNAQGACRVDQVTSKTTAGTLAPVANVRITMYAATDTGHLTPLSLFADAGLTAPLGTSVLTDSRGSYTYCTAANATVTECFAGGAIASRCSGPVTVGGMASISAANYPTIQAAHDALPQAGGELRVPCGKYGLLNITKSNVKLVGQGTCSELDASAISDNVVTIAAGVSNVSIDGIKIVGGGKTFDETNYFLGNCIYANGTTGAHLANITVRNTYESACHNGTYFQYVDGGEITGNWYAFAHFGLTEVDTDRSNGIRVHHNHFLTTGGAVNAIYSQSRSPNSDDPQDHNVYSDNVITGNFSFEAINVFGAWNTISGNTITLTGAAINSTGIQLQQQAATHVTAHDNTVTGNTITITGVGGTGNFGITVNYGGYSTSRLPYGNVVTGNSVTMTATSADPHYCYVTGSGSRNSIIGNSCNLTGVGSTASEGVLIGDAVNGGDNIASGNLVVGASGNGIEIQTPRTRVENNTVMSGTNAGAAGIFVPPTAGAAANSTITRNYLYNNLGRAIAVSTGSGTGILIDWNVEVGNGLSDLFNTAVTGIDSANNVYSASTTPIGALAIDIATVTHAALDLASVATAACTAETTETATGAAFGDTCTVEAGTAMVAGTFNVCKVTAASTVKWQHCNLSGVADDRASDTYTIHVRR